jgi:3-hydroxybutyryl-CoA dehydratase
LIPGNSVTNSTITGAGKKFAAIEGLAVGQSASVTLKVSDALVDAFAELSGDHNPLHMDDAFAQSAGFTSRVAHGALLTAYVSRLIGTKLPGAGCLWLKHQVQWRMPVFVDDVVEITARIKHISIGTNIVLLSMEAHNQQGTIVMDGEGAVAITTQRISNHD